MQPQPPTSELPEPGPSLGLSCLLRGPDLAVGRRLRPQRYLATVGESVFNGPIIRPTTRATGSCPHASIGVCSASGCSRPCTAAKAAQHAANN